MRQLKSWEGRGRSLDTGTVMLELNEILNTKYGITFSSCLVVSNGGRTHAQPTADEKVNVVLTNVF